MHSLKKRIQIINGPNLNLLGKREPSVYGSISFEQYMESHLPERYKEQFEISIYQNNCEGRLIDKIHEVGFSYDGIIINAGAYTHTSLALLDAIQSIETPVIEVHISNVHKREKIRHESIIAKGCVGTILGFGMDVYRLALEAFNNIE